METSCLDYKTTSKIIANITFPFNYARVKPADGTLQWTRCELRGIHSQAGPQGHRAFSPKIYIFTFAFSNWAWACRSASLRTASRSSSKDTSESDGRLV